MNISELLREKGVEFSESIFNGLDGALLKFDMDINAKTSAASVDASMMLSVRTALVEKLKSCLLERDALYKDVKAELSEIEERLSRETNSVYEIRELRLEKKNVSARLAQIEESMLFVASMLITDTSEPQKTVCADDVVHAVNISGLCEYIPPLRQLVGNEDFNDRPFFVSSVPEWRDSWESGREIAVEGGPWLFGAFVCAIDLGMKNGGVTSMDFVTDECVVDKREELSEVRFRFAKPSLTRDEICSLERVFEMAKCFNAAAYIPLPDFSYEKYTAALLRQIGLDENGTNRARESFRVGTRKITRLYLDAIEDLRLKYPSVDVKVVYSESTELLKRYYAGRAGFLEKRARKLRNLTSHELKRESVLDYITMPALPFYLDGITDVIQVDCLDELGSFRKCRSLHSGAFKLHACLYPESISGDGKHTAYYAAPCFKEYSDLSVNCDMKGE